MKLFVPLLRKKFKKIKTMKKKLLIVALIAITFIGCGGKDKSTQEQQKTKNDDIVLCVKDNFSGSFEPRTLTSYGIFVKEINDMGDITEDNLISIGDTNFETDTIAKIICYTLQKSTKYIILSYYIKHSREKYDRYNPVLDEYIKNDYVKWNKTKDTAFVDFTSLKMIREHAYELTVQHIKVRD